MPAPVGDQDLDGRWRLGTSASSTAVQHQPLKSLDKARGYTSLCSPLGSDSPKLANIFRLLRALGERQVMAQLISRKWFIFPVIN
jgi:hypothetical protein